MKTVPVAAAIICRGEGADLRILAAQRGYGEFEGGWEFPGGKLEPGETAAHACAREIREELGVEIAGLEPLCTVEYDYPAFHLSMACFTCRIAAGTIDDTEHEALRWLAPSELRAVGWLPADIEVVAALERRLAGGRGR